MTATVTVNFDGLSTASVDNVSREYSETDVMLYALGVGFGHDGVNSRELDFIFEGRGLKAVPSMAGVLVGHDFLEKSGLDITSITLAEQKLELYRPLPPRAELQTDSRVLYVLDHGREKGLSITVESEVRLARDATVLFTLSSTFDTGPGDLRGPEGSGPAPHTLPSREADLHCNLVAHETLPYIFRVRGDRNDRYADNAVARAQGLPQAPLHEQCVAGMACRAILKTICDYDYTLIGSFDLRFTGLLYPGETLVTEMWQDRNVVSFRCVVPGRDEVVVDNGKCLLAV